MPQVSKNRDLGHSFIDKGSAPGHPGRLTVLGLSACQAAKKRFSKLEASRQDIIGYETIPVG
jgi:hypothetical protein